MNEPTSTGVDARLSSVLCYAGWWVTGIVFLFAERRHSGVRFHAAQSIVVFGALSVLPVFDKWSGHLSEYVFSNFVPNSASAVQGYLRVFRDVFERTGHGAHYRMMMRISEDASEDGGVVAAPIGAVAAPAVPRARPAQAPEQPAAE